MMRIPLKPVLWSAASVAAVVPLAALVVEARDAPPDSAMAVQVERHGEMSMPRAAHQATLLATGQVLITGGCADPGCSRIVAATELYDPVTGAFLEIVPMSTPRASHSATRLADGRVLVVGGWTGPRETASAEIYDPSTGSWSSAGDMTEPRVSSSAVPLADGRVLVTGGGSAEVFDPATSTFSAAGRTRHAHYLGTALPDGRFLMTGGDGPAGDVLRAAQIFDPRNGRFRSTGDMTVPRHKHAAALMQDGKVLVIGGSDGRGYRGRYASTEIYDPETGTFSPGPRMNAARDKIRDAVVVLPSGLVLVAGGAPRPELYDPARGVMMRVRGKLDGPRMFATATLLATGDVLILGGYDDRIRPSASAWLVGAERAGR